MMLSIFRQNGFNREHRSVKILPKPSIKDAVSNTAESRFLVMHNIWEYAVSATPSLLAPQPRFSLAHHKKNPKQMKL
ncbi:MAG: hypothetical protein P8176_10170 [Gammaproteobacteria bacterium]